MVLNRRKPMSKREDILNAAKALLWERGYEAMSPRAVMDASGAGQGSLYHHLRTKQDLAAAALEQVAAELIGDFDSFLARAPGSSLDRIRAWLLRPRDGLAGCRLGRLANETALDDERLRAPLCTYFSHVQRRLGALVDDAMAEGMLPESLDGEKLAAMLVAVIQGGYVLSRARRDARFLGHATAGACALLEQAARNG